jgi:hypothetical protein
MRHKVTTELRYPGLWLGCVGAWNPGLGPSGLTLRDWSAYGNHGTLTNMDAAADWIVNSGRYSLSLSASDYIAINKPAWTGGAKTIVAWINLTTIGQNNMILGASTSPNSGFSPHLRFTSSNVLRFWNYDASFLVDSTTVFSANKLVCVAGMFDGVTSSVWVAGKRDNTNTGDSAIDAGVNWRLGSDALFGLSLAGKLAEVRLYSRAILSTEHQLLAVRPGIAYELAPRRRASVAVAAGGFKAAWIPRRSLIVGGGTN